MCIHFCLYASSHMAVASPVDWRMDFALLTLSCTASAPSISPHWHRLGLVLHVVEVGEGALQLPSVDGLRRLARVLERHTQVGPASAGALGRFDVGGGVADHVVVVGGGSGWVYFFSFFSLLKVSLNSRLGIVGEIKYFYRRN